MAVDAVSDASVDVRDGRDAFIEKWRARWPEWRIAETFVPPAERPSALAWAALRQEFTDAAWAHRDTRPGDAKLAWWAEELHGWSRGARRHPLGIELHRIAAPWSALAGSLLTLPATRERPRDFDDALLGVGAIAEAIGDIDVALSGHAAGASVPAISAQLLATRAATDIDSAVPLSLLTQSQGEQAAGRWRDALLARWPASSEGRVARRVEAALARGRLRQGDLQAPLGAIATLATAWRAARV